MPRSLYIADSELLTWYEVGVFVYDSDAHTTTPVAVDAPSGDAYHFYEVAVVQGEGSWWLPTTTHSSTALWDANGGTLPLAADGAGTWTQDALGPVQRPAQLLFWLPQEVWSNPNLTSVPGMNIGHIDGDWPILEPAGGGGGGGGEIQVHETADGVTVVIQPGQQAAIVAISIGDPDGTA